MQYFTVPGLKSILKGKRRKLKRGIKNRHISMLEYSKYCGEHKEEETKKPKWQIKKSPLPLLT